MEPWQLVAHTHWFTLRIFGREVRLCARCSGYLAGLLAFTIPRRFFGLPFFLASSIQLRLLFCLLLVIPLTYDWLTQSWGLRESNNYLRFLTGAILGVGVSLLSSIELLTNVKTSLYVCITALITLFGYVGRRLSDSHHYLKEV